MEPSQITSLKELLLLLMLLASTALALSSVSDGDDNNVIDLQELLLKVHNSYQDFSQGLKELRDDTDKMVGLIKENFRLVNNNLNKIAKRVDENAKRTEDVINSNAKSAEKITNSNSKRCEEIINNNTKSVEEIMNANAIRVEDIMSITAKCADANANRTEETIKTNAERANENLKEISDVLKLILNATDSRGEGTGIKETCQTPTPTTTAKMTTEPSPESTTSTLLDLSPIPTIQPTTVTIQAHVKDCAELYSKGERSSGIYHITVANYSQESFKVFCDMETDGGGWTMFQNRGDYGLPKDYFYRNWTEYKNGFGDLNKEFWLGNDRISALSFQESQQMRVDLWDMKGNKGYAKYATFRIENERELYILRIGRYSGNIGDGFSYSPNQPFSTKDKDNSQGYKGCPVTDQGAWWYFYCNLANLNGLNLRETNNQSGIFWYYWKQFNSMAFTEMKLRPANF